MRSWLPTIPFFEWPTRIKLANTVNNSLWQGLASRKERAAENVQRQEDSSF